MHRIFSLFAKYSNWATRLNAAVAFAAMIRGLFEYFSESANERKGRGRENLDRFNSGNRLVCLLSINVHFSGAKAGSCSTGNS